MEIALKILVEEVLQGDRGISFFLQTSGYEEKWGETRNWII